MSEEWFDVVDDGDEVVGRRLRADIHRLGLKHRAVHVLVFNRRGELFLQKRSLRKDCFPGAWDSSAAGHVEVGETYDACAARELQEELGLTIVQPPERLFKLDACPATGQEFVWVYRCQSEGPFQLHPEEIERGAWVSPSTLAAWLEQRPLDFAPGFVLLWREFLGRGLAPGSRPLSPGVPDNVASAERHLDQGQDHGDVSISLVLPAFNEEKLIGRSLAAVRTAAAAFERRQWPIELIVCDNNSTDRTGELARAAGATVVFEPINQIARARNRGAAAATGNWLVFIDADSFPSAALFEAVAREIETGRCAGGGATVQLEDVRGMAWVLNRLWNRLSRTMRWAAGSFIFCDARAFRELGGFCEELFASEEIDLSRRLKRWARRARRRVVILSQHPLSSSGRKAQLLGTAEYFRLLWDTVLQRGANLRRRDACALWYDGRR